MASQSISRFLYGADYNPDQWPREVWDEDMRLFRLAGVNVATVAAFSWAYLQPSEGQLNFAWLDKIMDRLHANGISVCLATATAVHPAWLSRKYPGILAVTIDGHDHTRVFHECAEMGREQARVGESILGARSQARVGIIFDWENWWAIELSSGPSVALKYLPQIQKHYRASYHRNIPVDFLPEEADFSGYDLIVAPVMYMVKPGVASRLEEFVRQGGTFVTTFFSGLVDDADLVALGGYPGELRKLPGIWAEEIDALFPEQRNAIVVEEPFGALQGKHQCGLLCDLVHLEGARALAVYGKDFYAGRPALNENRYGVGKACYLATDPEEPFLAAFLGEVCQAKGIRPVLETPAGVEATQRVKGDRVLTFVLNHSAEPAEVDLGPARERELIGEREVSEVVTVPGRGVMILEAGGVKG